MFVVTVFNQTPTFFNSSFRLRVSTYVYAMYVDVQKR